MIVEFLITFRETFEAVLILSIIISYLEKIGESSKKKFVLLGAFAGVIFSIIGAIIFQILLGGFEGQLEEAFEGVMMIIGSLMITTLIIWLHKRSNSLQKIEETIQKSLDQTHVFGLIFLAFISVFREGIETIL